jgi:hypothetical protein
METIKNNALKILAIKNSHEFAKKAEKLLFKKDETYRDHVIESVKSIVQQLHDKARELGFQDAWSDKFSRYNIGTLERSISQRAKIQMGMASRNTNVSTFKYINGMRYPDWMSHHILYALTSGKKVRCECASRHPAILAVIKTVASTFSLKVSDDESEEKLFLIFEPLL